MYKGFWHMVIYLILQQSWKITYINPRLQLQKLELRYQLCALDCTASRWQKWEPQLSFLEKDLLAVACEGHMPWNHKMKSYLCPLFVGERLSLIHSPSLHCLSSPRESGIWGWGTAHREECGFPSLQRVQALNLWHLPHYHWAVWKVLHVLGKCH